MLLDLLSTAPVAWPALLVSDGYDDDSARVRAVEDIEREAGQYNATSPVFSRGESVWHLGDLGDGLRDLLGEGHRAHRTALLVPVPRLDKFDASRRMESNGHSGGRRALPELLPTESFGRCRYRAPPRGERSRLTKPPRRPARSLDQGSPGANQPGWLDH